jgi:toxin-antitoxin system PIN domain toxin
MKTRLLDINLLLALSWSHHVHHELAHQWLAHSRSSRLAYCTVTQLGFVRISLQPAFAPGLATAAELRARLAAFFRSHRGVFLAEPAQGMDEPALASRLDAVLTAAQVTDAYLTGLAAFHKAVVVTLDQSFVNLHPGFAELARV